MKLKVEAYRAVCLDDEFYTESLPEGHVCEGQIINDKNLGLLFVTQDLNKIWRKFCLNDFRLFEEVQKK